jgi:transcriptional regulator with XRE-family HTH domain
VVLNYITFTCVFSNNIVVIFTQALHVKVEVHTTMSFGNRLSTVRKDRKVSQGDLAGKAGIHLNVIGRYERGEAMPSIEIAAKIAEALKVSLDYLVLGKSELDLDQALLEKVLSIQQLPEEDREHILYSIDGLIQHAKTRLAYKK